MSLTPKAVMRVRPDKVAIICAWCDDKNTADEWAENRGYEVSHGLCLLHLKKSLDEIAKKETTEAELLRRLGN